MFKRYANRFRNSRRQCQSKRRSGSAKGSGLLARTSSKQPYAKNGSYDQFEHAYKTGYNSFFKYPGQNFDDVENDIALGYEQAKPGSALPWDTVLPAVNAVWDRLGGIISPRDPSRGVREWL